MSTFKLRVSIVRESESLASLIQAQYTRIRDSKDEAEKAKLKENLTTLQESEAARLQKPDRPVFNAELVLEPAAMPLAISLATQLLAWMRSKTT